MYTKYTTVPLPIRQTNIAYMNPKLIITILNEKEIIIYQSNLVYTYLEVLSF